MQIKKIKETVLKLIKAHHSPHEIALGVAIGVFIAILPLYGLHTLLCFFAMFLVPRANKLAMLLGTNISLPFTVATITWTGYDIGRLILYRKNYPPLSWEYFRHFKMETIKEFYYPLFTGSVALGLLCAVFFYFLCFFVAKIIEREHPHAN